MPLLVTVIDICFMLYLHVHVVDIQMQHQLCANIMILILRSETFNCNKCHALYYYMNSTPKLIFSESDFRLSLLNVVVLDMTFCNLSSWMMIGK